MHAHSSSDGFQNAGTGKFSERIDWEILNDGLRVGFAGPCRFHNSSFGAFRGSMITFISIGAPVIYAYIFVEHGSW